MSIANDPVSVYVFIVFGLFFLVLGTVGNITSLIILRRSALHRLKIRPYLIALAIFDLLVLYLTLAPALAIISLGSKSKPRSTMQCRLLLYSGFFVIDCSSWITVAITIERLLYIVRPHMIRPQRGTTIALCLTIGLVAVINIPIAMGWTAVKGKCTVDKIYYMVNFGVCSYIPAIIMIVSNVVITYTLCRRPKLGPSTATTKRNNSIRIALAINLIFLGTTFPMSIVWAIIGRLYLPLYLMNYANYSVNFVMYIIAGQMFRQELKILCCMKSACCQKSDTYSPTSAKATSTASTTDTSV